MRIVRIGVCLLMILMAMGAVAQSQTQEGCFPLSQTFSGPITLTAWCQIVDYSGGQPLTVSDTGEFLTLARGFSSTTMSVQADNWYSAMDVVIQLEFLHGGQDIVTFPFSLHYDGLNTYTATVPIVLNINAGDRVRLIQQSFLPHPCGLVDNCGLHLLLTFQ